MHKPDSHPIFSAENDSSDYIKRLTGQKNTSTDQFTQSCGQKNTSTDQFIQSCGQKQRFYCFRSYPIYKPKFFFEWMKISEEIFHISSFYERKYFARCEILSKDEDSAEICIKKYWLGA